MVCANGKRVGLPFRQLDMSGLCQRQACEFAFQAIRHAWSAVVSAPGLTDIFDARWVLSLSPRLGYASWRSYDCIAVSRHFHGLGWVEVGCGHD